MRRNKRTLAEFIVLANEKHGGKYTYTEYVDWNTKIPIECKEHGIFWQRPRMHLFKNGCPECGRVNRGSKNKIGLTAFIEKSNLIHNFKYDYKLVVYINVRTDVEIICPIHGIFLQNAKSHMRGNGCNLCAQDGFKLTQKMFEAKANEVHNFTYSYVKSEYINNYTKLIIECSKHGQFLQLPADHLQGRGCPKCSRLTSKQETAWLNSLNISGLLTHYTIRTEKCRAVVDGFDPATKTVYEFYGDYWHGNPGKYEANDYNEVAHATYGELYNATILRENSIKEMGYKIVSMWENDWKKTK